MKGGKMARYRLLVFVIVALAAAFLSCYKIPSSAPEWGITIRIPLGDSLVTAQQVVDDTLVEKVTIEVDPLYHPTRWTVFHHSDTTIVKDVNVPPGLTDQFLLHIYQNVSDNIDTTSSVYHSLAKKLITKVHLVGSCTSATGFSATVVCSLFPPVYLQHFTPYAVPFPVYIPPAAYFDTLLNFVVDSFPLGPYRDSIFIFPDSGGLYVDSSMGYAKMPINFLSRGDTIVTFLKGIEIDSSFRVNEDKDRLKALIVHLEFTNRTSAGFTGNFRIGARDSSQQYSVYHGKTFTIDPAPRDINGFTTGDSTLTVYEDTILGEYITMTDEDSLWWKASINIPALDTIFLRPEDWLRVYGWLSAEVWLDSLWEGE
jgi:hypothetical protein